MSDRLHGDNITAECDAEGCTRITHRDALHTCRFCGGWFCDGHILLADGGLACRTCYGANKAEIEAEAKRRHGQA